MITVTPVRGLRRGRMTTTGHMAMLGHVSEIRATPADAKAAVLATAEKAMSGSYNPALVRFGMHVALVWRDLDGWTYRLMATNDLPRDSVNTLYGTSTCTLDRDNVVRRAVYCLAQQAYDPVSDQAIVWSSVRHDVSSLFAFVTHPADQRELAEWIGFQRAYRAYLGKVDAGLPDDSDPHTFACQHAAEYAPKVTPDA